MIKIVFCYRRKLWFVKVGAFFVDIEISFYIYKCKTLLSRDRNSNCVNL